MGASIRLSRGEGRAISLASSASAPQAAASSRAQSSAERPWVPTWSRVQLMGITSPVEIRPCVGLWPKMPVKDEGIRTEPRVSLPSAAAHRPADTAAADPPEEPPALEPCFHGLWVRPNQGLSVRAPNAPSCMLTSPRITAPAARSWATTGASSSAMRSRKAPMPACQGRPATAMLAFTAMGAPSIMESAAPRAHRSALSWAACSAAATSWAT